MSYIDFSISAAVASASDNNVRLILNSSSDLQWTSSTTTMRFSMPTVFESTLTIGAATAGAKSFGIRNSAGTITVSGTPTGNFTITVPSVTGTLALTQTQTALTDGATITWDVGASMRGRVTLGGNRTLSITNPASGMVGTLEVIQDATGSRTLTHNAVSIPLASAANAVTILRFYYNGTNYRWESVTTFTVT